MHRDLCTVRGSVRHEELSAANGHASRGMEACVRAGAVGEGARTRAGERGDGTRLDVDHADAAVAIVCHEDLATAGGWNGDVHAIGQVEGSSCADAVGEGARPRAGEDRALTCRDVNLQDAVLVFLGHVEHAVGRSGHTADL